MTTIAWVLVTFITQPTDQKKLLSFYKLIRPAAKGWQPVINKALGDNDLKKEDINTGKLPLQILGMFIACITVYAILFGTGYWISGNMSSALISMLVALVGSSILFKIWNSIQEA